MSPEPPSLLYASAFDRTGYAAAARRYLRSLRTVGRPVAWKGLRNTTRGYLPTDDVSDAPEEILQLPTVAAPGATLIAHCIPHSWPALQASVPTERFIGQTVWEADPMPQRWHRELAPAHELWVPTRWNADVLAASGIDVPIHVVPHAIDSIAPATPPIELDPSRFVFLSISTWDWRKRPDLVLHAFLRAFTADDPVVLVLKTDAQVLSWRCHTDAERFTWWQVMHIVRQYRSPAEVMLVTDALHDAHMAGLTRAANCYVTLTCTEGWGLGAFDAAAIGCPVIITGHGGQVEWLGADHPGLVPFHMAPADHPDGSMFEDGMTWAIADVDAAADMMRAVFEGSSPINAAAPALAQRLQHDYSEAAIGRLMTGLLA